MPDGSNPQRNLRVVVAEDQYLTREGSVRLLDEQPGIEVVGTAGSRDEVVAVARELRPDVILMDVKMPPSNTTEGIDAAHLIKASSREGVVVLTQHDDEEYVWALLEKGVDGYGHLHKVRMGDVETLVRALQEVAAGRSMVDPRILHAAEQAGQQVQLAPGTPDPGRARGPGCACPREAATRRSPARSPCRWARSRSGRRRSSRSSTWPRSQVNRRVTAVLLYLRETAS